MELRRAGKRAPTCLMWGPDFRRPISALVLELVEGDTLADRIARGANSLNEAPQQAGRRIHLRPIALVLNRAQGIQH